jgi:hypothetical protein
MFIPSWLYPLTVLMPDEETFYQVWREVRRLLLAERARGFDDLDLCNIALEV